jgi:hypothetical protein
MTYFSRRQFTAAVTGALAGHLASGDVAISTLRPEIDNGIRLSGLWRTFCTRLVESADVMDWSDAPATGLDQAEALRYLSRLTRAAFDMFVESADPDFPRIYTLSDETLKIGADNPNNQYGNAAISSEKEYRVYGKRGDAPYMSFETKGVDRSGKRFFIDTGHIESREMYIEKDGTYELIVSREKRGRNWLRMTAESSQLLVRQTFADKKAQAHGTVQIEQIGGPKYPAPLSAEKMDKALTAASAFVKQTALTFAEWVKMFMTRPNEMLAWDPQIFKHGGEPTAKYLHGYWKIAADEVWIVRATVPKARWWNFQLDNWWMETLDYVHHNIQINSSHVTPEKDGTVVFAIASRDPGFGNWIDTSGHTSGTALVRVLEPESAPSAQCKVIKLT